LGYLFGRFGVSQHTDLSLPAFSTLTKGSRVNDSSLLYFVHALSPLHMGSGTSTGAIDLPHAREASSGLPYAPGSGVKGVLRDSLRARLSSQPTRHTALFGADWNSSDNRDQGALMISDARLLCLPVRSYSGGHAWVTSPMALNSYRRELDAIGPKNEALKPVKIANSETALLAEVNSPLASGDQILLHGIQLSKAAHSALAVAWAHHFAAQIFGQRDSSFSADFQARFAIVSEDVFSYLAVVAMDVRTRVRLNDDSKVVADSGPWVEENLPLESILWGSIAADPAPNKDRSAVPAAEVLSWFRGGCGVASNGSPMRLQIGGKATVGRGVAHFILSAAPPAKEA
jgi:CRISPR-associated protein Cmr4